MFRVTRNRSLSLPPCTSAFRMHSIPTDYFAGRSVQFDSTVQVHPPPKQLNPDSSDSCVLSEHNGIQRRQWMSPQNWEFHIIVQKKLAIPPPMPRCADAGATQSDAGNWAQSPGATLTGASIKMASRNDQQIKPFLFRSTGHRSIGTMARFQWHALLYVYI